MNDAAPLGIRRIPTYRRPELLDRALQSIVPQAQALDAPIYIPDDSCDRTNVTVIGKWQQSYPRLIHEISRAQSRDRSQHRQGRRRLSGNLRARDRRR